jgi:hypothetical protein
MDDEDEDDDRPERQDADDTDMMMTTLMTGPLRNLKTRTTMMMIRIKFKERKRTANGSFFFRVHNI